MTPPDPLQGEEAQEARHEKVLDALFSDDPEPQDDPAPGDDDPEPQDDPAPGDDDPEPQDDPAPGDDDPEPQDEDDEDYEKPVGKKAGDEEDEEPKDETMARKMAKENGRKAKQLEARATELELELERIKTEKEELAARLNEVQAVQVDPRDYPEVKQITDRVMGDVKRSAAMLGARNPQVFRENFGVYLQSFMDAEPLEDAELDTAIAALRGKIIKEVGGFEDDYEDLDYTEQLKADAIADKAMATIERAVPETRKAMELAEKLKSRAKVSQFAVGTREYETALAEFKPVLDAVGDLPEEAISADPHSVPAVVARMVKESPEARRRVEKAKADVLEIILGPRALTPDEVAKLEANGKDLKSFYAERQKLVNEKRKKLLPLIVQGLATRAIFNDSLKKLAAYEADKADEDREFDAMDSVRQKKPAAPKKKAVAGPRRNSVLTELFGERYDEL